jgi:hypothetical protein
LFPLCSFSGLRDDWPDARKPTNLMSTQVGVGKVSVARLPYWVMHASYKITVEEGTVCYTRMSKC